MRLYFFLISQSLRVLSSFIAYGLHHVVWWVDMLECVEADDNSNGTITFIEFDSILEYVVKYLLVQNPVRADPVRDIVALHYLEREVFELHWVIERWQVVEKHSF